MTQAKILTEKACEQLERGYYFFEDVMDTDILEFPSIREVSYDEEFKNLQESIHHYGIQTPIQLSYDSSLKKLKILAGARRVRAIERIRLASEDKQVYLPALLLVSDQKSQTAQLDESVSLVVSNLMAKSLSQIEKMRCYKTLLDKGMTKKEIARCCGKDRKTVERSLQLSQFDDKALEFIEENEKAGNLKARNVEIIGQNLKNALKEAKKKIVEENKDKGSATEGELAGKLEEVELPKEQEESIRDSAFSVLQQEVRRREASRQPKSEAEKIALKEKRENKRVIDLRGLENALKAEFDGGQITRIIAIIDHLSQIDKEPSATEQVASGFRESKETMGAVLQ